MDNRYNYGIALLKILCSFLVIMCHFEYSEENLQYIKTLAVPCFMMISFYLQGFKLFEGDRGYCIKRLKRQIIPFWFWGGVLGSFLF